MSHDQLCAGNFKLSSLNYFIKNMFIALFNHYSIQWFINPRPSLLKLLTHNYYVLKTNTL